MKVNYIDSSVLVAILLNEPSSEMARLTLAKESIIQSSSLIESEIISVCKREKVEFQLADSLLDSIDIVSPPSSIRPYIKDIIEYGYVRGADLQHLACALYLCGNTPKYITFWSFDVNQSRVAKKVGFRMPKV